MEGALKMARAHGHKISPEKFEMVSLDNSFHGRTLGALSVTGQPKYRRDFEPLLPGVNFVPPNDIAALERRQRSHGRHRHRVDPGRGRHFPDVRRVWPKGARAGGPLRRAADFRRDPVRRRTVRARSFGYQLADPVVLPDVMVAAKPVACGMPLGVIVANERAAAAIGPGMHGSTFGGSALACRVALEFFRHSRRAAAVDPPRRRLLPRRASRSWRAGTPSSAEVRGHGLMIGVDMNVPGKQMVLDAQDRGLLMNCTHDTVLRFLPPYIVTEREVDAAIDDIGWHLCGAAVKVNRRAGSVPAV